MLCCVVKYPIMHLLTKSCYIPGILISFLKETVCCWFSRDSAPFVFLFVVRHSCALQGNHGDVYISIDDINADAVHRAIEESGPDSVQDSALELDHITESKESQDPVVGTECDDLQQFTDAASVFSTPRRADNGHHQEHSKHVLGQERSTVAGGTIVAVCAEHQCCVLSMLWSCSPPVYQRQGA